MFDVSKSALKRIFTASEKNKKKFFRISVDGGGCQGFSYKFDFDDVINDDDKILEYEKVKVLIDNTSWNLLKGSKLDFVQDMIGSYFKISNLKQNLHAAVGFLSQFKLKDDYMLMEY